MGSREGERAGDGPKTERRAVRPRGRPRHALPTAYLWVKGSLIREAPKGYPVTVPSLIRGAGTLSVWVG